MKLDCTAEIPFGASLKWPLQELQFFQPQAVSLGTTVCMYLQYQEMDTDLVQTTIETIASFLVMRKQMN